MSKKKDGKKKRNRDLTVLWKGKVARIIGQGSDSEVMLLERLITHKEMTNDQKYLVLEGAIFEVWGQRLTDREEEAKVRRQRAREQQKQEKEFSEPAEASTYVDPRTPSDSD